MLTNDEDDILPTTIGVGVTSPVGLGVGVATGSMVGVVLGDNVGVAIGTVSVGVADAVGVSTVAVDIGVAEAGHAVRVGVEVGDGVGLASGLADGVGVARAGVGVEVELGRDSELRDKEGLPPDMTTESESESGSALLDDTDADKRQLPVASARTEVWRTPLSQKSPTQASVPMLSGNGSPLT